MALNRLGLLPQIKPQFFYTGEVKERKEDALPTAYSFVLFVKE